MTRREIIFSPQADIDMYGVEAYIRDVLKAAATASRYMEGMSNTIQKLSYIADAVGANEYVQDMFGADVRHVVFKKMAVIFYPEDDTVYILRVIPCSLIY
jgi:hypothetical protein